MESFQNFVDKRRLKFGVGFIFVTGLVIIFFGIPILISHPEYNDPYWLRIIVGLFMCVGVMLYGKKSIENLNKFWAISIPIFPGWSLLMLFLNEFAPRYMITVYLVILGYSVLANTKKELTYFLLGYLSCVLIIAFSLPHTKTPLGDLVPTIIFASGVIYLSSISLIFLRDAYKKHEHELLKQFTQLEQMNLNLIDANKLTEQALKSRTQFLSLLSHELRTPLNAIMGSSDELLHNNPRPDQNSALNTLHNFSSHILLSVDSLLAYLTLEKSSWQFQLETLSLHDFSKNLGHEILKNYEQESSLIQFDISTIESHHFKFDPFLMSLILRHLLANAIKFNQNNNPIHFEIYQNEDQSLRFSVRDSGIGIKSEQIAAIGQILQQLDTGIARKFDGLGLGLALIKKILGQMNSQLHIQSQENEGSVFSFTLNLEQALVAKTYQEHKIELSEDLSKPQRVLLVEDNKMNIKIACRFLEKWEKDVTVAENGQIALDIIQSQGPFDAILMDIHMPVMDGIEAIKHIRSMNDEILRNQKIIILTASVTRESLVQLEGYEIQGFLNKPIKGELLKSALVA